MARASLMIGATIWLLAAAAAIGAAIIGSARIRALIPELVIDADAIGGALTAAGLAMAAIGLAHFIIVVGLGRHHRWAASAGVLLGSVLAIGLVALAVTSLTSAILLSSVAALLVAGAIGAALMAIGYGLLAVRLVRTLRSDAPI